MQTGTAPQVLNEHASDVGSRRQAEQQRGWNGQQMGHDLHGHNAQHDRGPEREDQDRRGHSQQWNSD